MRIDEKLSDAAALSDEELVQRLQSGDEQAAPVLVQRYRPLVASLASGFSVSGPDTDDLIQEGLISLISAAYAYRQNGEASFRTFLGVCVNNRMRTLVKRSTFVGQTPPAVLVPIEDLDLPGGIDPERIVLSDEACVDLYRLFDKVLSGLERQVLLRRLAGRSRGDIAEALGVSEKSVDNALTRARAKLKAALSTQ